MSHLSELPAILSIEQAALLVGISAATLRRNLADGRFPRPVRIGRVRKGWRRADLEDWIAQGGYDGWVDAGGQARTRSDELLMMTG